MSDNNTAKSVLWPTDSRVLVRACFLYVGQGSSILLLVKDSDSYQVLLVDSNLDKENGGIDIPRLVEDLAPDGSLYAFVNTHPHDDHLRGLKELRETVTIERVWHSGHVPSQKHGNYHADLKDVIKDVEKKNGSDAIVELTGSKSEQSLLDASMYTLAPAKHVNDDVNDEDADKRYSRIHENCAVLRIGKGPSWVLITGDADLIAFKEHITNYHKDRLGAFALDASHHGSRSFFKAKEEDEPYLDALKAIDPEHVVISAPTEEESPFDHPHKDAVKLYSDHVGEYNVHHTGDERECFFFDIYDDGTHSDAQTDGGDLAEAYGLGSDDDGKGRGALDKGKRGPFVRPKDSPDFKPRKYG